MLRAFRPLLAAAALCLAAIAAMAQSPGPLAGQVYGSGKTALVVIVHGDVSKGGPADYHYDTARKIAAQNKGVTVLALLRPGYPDSRGQRSPGSDGGRRDHYTKRSTTLVAQTIQNMAKSIGARRVVGIGHSGGAAHLGVIAGAYPGLLDSAILVSCPCDIAKWRAAKGASRWTKSQSPHKFLGKVPKSTRITLINGTNDKNTRPREAQDFVAKAQARGLNATYIPANGAGHGFNRMSALVAKTARQHLR